MSRNPIPVSHMTQSNFWVGYIQYVLQYYGLHSTSLDLLLGFSTVRTENKLTSEVSGFHISRFRTQERKRAPPNTQVWHDDDVSKASLWVVTNKQCGIRVTRFRAVAPTSRSSFRSELRFLLPVEHHCTVVSTSECWALLYSIATGTW